MTASTNKYDRADRYLIWDLPTPKEGMRFPQFHIMLGTNRIDCFRVKQIDSKGGITEVFQYTLNEKPVQVTGTSPALAKRTSVLSMADTAHFDLEITKKSETDAMITFTPSQTDEVNNPVTIFSEEIDNQSPPLPDVDVQTGLPVDRYTTPYQLALAIRYAVDTHNSLYRAYVDRALGFISNFYSRNVGSTKEVYQQLTVLVLSNNEEIAFEVLKLLLSEFESSPLLDLKLLKAIGDAFDAGQLDVDKPSIFKDSDRIATLRILLEKCKKIKEDCPTKQEIRSFLQTMTKTVIAMADPMRRHDQKLDINLHTELYSLFEGFEKQYHDDEAILAAAMTAKEALLILRKSRSDELILLFRVLYAAKGTLLLCKVIKSQDLLILPAAFSAFQQAAHSQKLPAVWYQHHIMLQGFVQVNAWEQFISFLQGNEIKDNKEKMHLLQHLLLTLGQVITKSRRTEKVLKGNDTTCYTGTITALSQLFLMPKTSYWHHFADLFKDFAKTHETEIVDLLKEVLRSAKSKNSNIRLHAHNLADKLMNNKESIISKDLLKKAGFPETLAEVTESENDKAMVVAPTTDIWEDSKPKETGAIARIAAGIQRYLKMEEMNSALAIFVQSKGSKKPDYRDRYSIRTHVMEKIENLRTSEKLDKKGKPERDVVLILAERMKGKTLTTMDLTQEIGRCWQKAFKHGTKPTYPFPLLMPFKSIKLSPDAVKDSLSGYPYYMSPTDQQECQDLQIPMAFIGDSPEEGEKLRNPHIALKLDAWNFMIKIIASRPLLMKKTEIHAMFSPQDKISNAPQVHRLEGTLIAPFEESDFWQCIKNYVEHAKDRTNNWTFERYQAELKEKQSLINKTFAEPSFAYVIAVSLPEIVRERGDSTVPVSDLELMTVFYEFCITRASGRIFNSEREEDEKEIDSKRLEGVRRELEKVGTDLAARMFAANTRSVPYTKRLETERPHPLEKILGHPVYREGLQIINTETDGIQFFPPIMQDLNIFFGLSKPIKEGQHEEDLSIISNLFTMDIEESFPHVLTFCAENVKASPHFAKALKYFQDPEFEKEFNGFVTRKLAESEKLKLKAKAKDEVLTSENDPAMMQPANVHVSKLSYKIGVENCKKILKASEAVAQPVAIIKIEEDDPIWV